MAVIDERTLCARLKSWADAELQSQPYGSLTSAENELHVSGSARRHDLAILAGTKRVFTCEVKLPTSPQGASPYDAEAVKDAREKAGDEGIAYFGTLNCASFVLWQYDMPGIPVLNRSLDRWKIVEPQFLTSLDGAEAEKAFRSFLKRLLTLAAAVEAGAEPMAKPSHQPEEELLARIEVSLDTIVGLTLPDVRQRFVTDTQFKSDVKRWMISDQGWQWDDKLRDELMPINKGMPLAELKRALQEYPKSPRGLYLIEYVLIKGVNGTASVAAHRVAASPAA